MQFICSDCNISSNSAIAAGGVAVNDGASVGLGTSWISQNTATRAAGIRSQGSSSVSVHHCIIAGNDAMDQTSGYGGGFWASGSSEVSLHETTVDSLY